MGLSQIGLPADSRQSHGVPGSQRLWKAVIRGRKRCLLVSVRPALGHGAIRSHGPLERGVGGEAVVMTGQGGFAGQNRVSVAKPGAMFPESPSLQGPGPAWAQGGLCVDLECGSEAAAPLGRWSHLSAGESRLGHVLHAVSSLS